MMKKIINPWRNHPEYNYVACWYKKAAEYMQANRHIRTALVSTNSITQGEQVAVLWQPLFDLGVEIDYAYRTFRWDSESNDKAKVHCVIIGFSLSGSLKTNNNTAEPPTVIASEQSESGNLPATENAPNLHNNNEIATTATQSRNDSNDFSGSLKVNHLKSLMAN